MFGYAAFGELAFGQFPGAVTGTAVRIAALLDDAPPRKVRIEKKKTYAEIEALISAEVAEALAVVEPEPDDELTEPERKQEQVRFDHIASLLQAANQASLFVNRGIGGDIRYVPQFAPQVPQPPPVVRKSPLDMRIEKFRLLMQNNRKLIGPSLDGMIGRFRQIMKARKS